MNTRRMDEKADLSTFSSSAKLQNENEEGVISQASNALADDADAMAKFDGISNLTKNNARLGERDKDRDKLGEKRNSNPSPSMGRKQAKESFKAMKQNYRREVKKRSRELSSALKDPSVTILSSWLKIRGTLKGWAKFWCVIKPGLLIIYKRAKHGQWVGTVLLNSCEVIARPSKKEGFCFKVYNPLEHYMWATKGPKGEIAGAIVQPMPKDHLILRAETESDGRCWMDALEVAQRQGYSIQRDGKGMVSDLYGDEKEEDAEDRDDDNIALPGGPDDDSNDGMDKSDSDNDLDDNRRDLQDVDFDEPIVETSYMEDQLEEYFGQAGEATEEIEDENKSILWALLKQVKPGMDLSRVTLPTFILEPRSFLDRLSDHYYHVDILSRAAKEENAYSRIKEVVRWYLSGFYKKPKGLKKPYNPIIGETFRCYWQHPACSRTFLVAEQVSHHPPVSAFYVSNRQEGFILNSSILAKSKFYGNSSSAILDGFASLMLLKFGEEYLMNMPYAHCKGILIGTLTMELGGCVTINCEKTGYRAEIEFKLKPFWKNRGESNYIAGKIKMGKETLCRIEGKWDGEILMTDLKTNLHGEEEPLPDLFWEPTADVRAKRLKRHIVSFDAQGDFESEKLWLQVSNAIKINDQEAATREKLILEEAQRKGHRERKEKEEEWVPKLFDRDPLAPDSINRWVYKYPDVRPWDPMTDLEEYEHDGIIKTRYRMRAPMIHSTSLLSVHVGKKATIPRSKRPSSVRSRLGAPKTSQKESMERSGASTPDPDGESSSVEDDDEEGVDVATLEKALQPLRDLQKECVQHMRAIRSDLRRHYSSHQDEIVSLQFKDWILLLLFVVAQGFFQWYFR